MSRLPLYRFASYSIAQVAGREAGGLLANNEQIQKG